MQAEPRPWTPRSVNVLDVPGSDVDGVGRSARLRIGAGGSRIVVVMGDPERPRRWGVSVWSADGALLLSLEPRDIAEGIRQPTAVRAGVPGFRLRHSGRSVWHAYEDGRVLRTMPHPSGFARFTALDPGGLLGFGRVPVWFDGDVAPETQAVIHVRAVDQGWEPDTIGFLDIRRQPWHIKLPPNPAQPHIVLEAAGAPQPFADYDLAQIDSEAGSVLIVRRNSAPGTAELVELLAAGDTAWHRRLVLEVMPLTPERAEEVIEATLNEAEANGALYLARPAARAVIKEAVYVPSHLPPVSRMVLTASREVWLKTPRERDGMVVWYSIPRRDEDSEPRRVLLPTTFQLQDAFGDRVWGFSTSDDGTRTAVGLLLVSPS